MTVIILMKEKNLIAVVVTDGIAVETDVETQEDKNFINDG